MNNTIYIRGRKIEVGGQLDGVVGRVEITEEQLNDIVNRGGMTVDLSENVMSIKELRHMVNGNTVVIGTGTYTIVQGNRSECEISCNSNDETKAYLKLTDKICNVIEIILDSRNDGVWRQCSFGAMVDSEKEYAILLMKADELIAKRIDKLLRDQYKDSNIYNMKRVVTAYRYTIPIEVRRST